MHIKEARSLSAGRPISASLQRLARTHLENLAGFGPGSRPIVDDWLDRGELQTYRRGETICTANLPSPGLQLLVEGVALAGKDPAKHYGCVMSVLRAGDIWGLVPAFSGPAAALDVIAHESSTVLIVPQDVVLSSAVQHPAVLLALSQQLAYRLRVIIDRLQDALTLPVSARLARCLEYMLRTFGVPHQHGTEIGLRLSQVLLSQLLGASRQQVNVELRKLQAAGLIELARETIVVRDPHAFDSRGFSAAPVTLTRRSESAST